MADESQKLIAGIYLVATPIGNLEDITLRALRVLRGCDVVACEDTRHTQKLLTHYDIQKPTVSYHEHNETKRAAELLGRVAKGESVALVSDAGMPGISDPGFRVVQLAIARGFAIFPIPGPVAFATALVASGLPTDQFRFVGFLPAQSGARRTALEGLRDERCTLVAYEAPHRISASLADLAAVFGGARQIVLARELTKVHEEFLRGPVESILAELTARDRVRGEFTLLIAGASREAAQPGAQGWPERIRELMTGEQIDERDALKRVARESGVAKSELYREWQRAGGARPKSKKDDR